MKSPDKAEAMDSSKSQSSADGEDGGLPEEETTPGGEQVVLKRRGKKRKRNDGKKKNEAPTDSPVERPSRERKSVVRYAAAAPRRLSTNKAVTVPQGSGEKLKDIPNVTFKFSKRKSDESLRVLHKVLFGRKTNVHYLKRNILQFSGFVWSQNEEKERLKVMEKLNKCNKDRLLEYCDLLDIYSLKVTTKKEEISAKLLEFLERPYATREVLLSEKDSKHKQRRRRVKGTSEKPPEEASPDRKNKRPKKNEKFEAEKDLESTAKADNGDLGKGSSIRTNLGHEDKNDDSDEAKELSSSETDEDNVHEEPESTKTLSDGEETELHEDPKFKEKSPSVRKVSHAKSKIVQSASAIKKANAPGKVKVQKDSKDKKNIVVVTKGNTSSSKSKKEKVVVKNDSKDNSTQKVSRRKGEPGLKSGLSSRSKKGEEKGKNNIGATVEHGKENKKKVAKTFSKDMEENKQIAKIKVKNSTKKGKHDALVGPSREKLHAVICDILKEVDFNVATLADIIKQLGAHFDTDLMHRKSEIKDILEEVINNMSDDEDAEDDDGGAEE